MRKKPNSGLGLSTLSSAVKQIAFVGTLLSQTNALAAQTCGSALKAGAQFLHERDTNLHTSLLVEKAAGLQHRTSGQRPVKPVDKLEAWLDYLERLSTKAERSPRAAHQLKSILYDRYVIKPDEIPASYFDHQVRIARERGQGDAPLSEAQRLQLVQTIIRDQQKSLDYWMEYLISTDTYMYPMWLKYWMYAGMTKLSKYDAKSGTFGHRSRETVAPFPELNREALAYVADAVLKKLNMLSLDEMQDPALVKLLEGMNFGKLYGHALLKIGPSKGGEFITNEGKWIVYKQGSDPLPLVKSLEGQNTGWCTAGESTAAMQLKSGDFHVYYSLDAGGNATIPRVAIRMENDSIAEVRGVSGSQNLDPQISQTQIVSSKLKEFGSRAEKFRKKDQDMKLLTKIEAKTNARIELTRDELLFLYEVHSEIEGFGSSRDPRIDEIKRKRDKKSDYVIVYDHKYKREEISLSVEEALTGDFEVHIGNLTWWDINYVRRTYLNGDGRLKFPRTVIGYLDVGGLDSAQGVTLPEILYGTLNLGDLKTADGVTLPKVMKGRLILKGLQSAHGLKLPAVIDGDLDLSGLTSAEGLQLPGTVNGVLTIQGLKSARSLKRPKGVTHVYGPTDFCEDPAGSCSAP